MNPNASAAIGNFLPSGKVGNQAKSAVYIILAILVVVIIIVAIKKGMSIFDSITGGANSFLEKIGVKDSEADTKAKQAADDMLNKASAMNSPFNPNYYKTVPGGTPLIISATLKNLADQIYDSVGVIYDDPESGLGAIKQAKNWAQVSQIADMFQQQYKKDLYSWLNIKYDTTAQKQVLVKIGEYAFNLPKS